MKRIAIIFCLVCAVLSTSARSYPVGLTQLESYVAMDEEVLLTKKFYVEYNKVDTSSKPYVLRWCFYEVGGDTLLVDERSCQLEVSSSTYRETFQAELPTRLVGSLTRSHEIGFTCLLGYKGKACGRVQDVVKLPARTARFEYCGLATDRVHTKVNYGLTDNTFDPKVELYINDAYVKDVWTGELLTLEDLTVAEQSLVPKFNEVFEWQLKVVDPITREVLDVTRVGQSIFAPLEASCERVTWSQTSKELVVTVHGLNLKHAGSLQPTICAALYTTDGLVGYQDNKGTQRSAFGKLSVSGDGIYEPLEIRVPLSPVYAKYGPSFTGDLCFMVYDGAKWTTIQSEKVALSNYKFDDPNAVFHLDHPLVNQGNGPVILHFTMSKRCNIANYWKKYVYNTQIEDWRRRGILFYYYDITAKESPEPYYKGEAVIDDELLKDIPKEYKSVAPVTLVFDGMGNCVSADKGFSVSQHEEVVKKLEKTLNTVEAYTRR